MNRTKHHRIAARQRRGAVLIAVVACLAVALALLTAMVSSAMLTHRQIRRQAIADQSHYLCQAATARAMQQLKTNSDFERDEWNIPAAELGGQGDAKVTVVTLTTDDGRRTFKIVARFPLSSTLETETTRIITIKQKHGTADL